MSQKIVTRLRTLTAVVAFGLASGRSDAGQQCTLDPTAIDRWLRREADSAGFSGVVLIERSGKVLLNRAYGHVARDNAFWIASTSKQFTAAAVLRLVDEGKLALSDSIYHFFRSAPRRARTITVEQLLTHTSGIAASGVANGIGDREEAMQAILSEPLDHAPGTTYHYEDEDYNVLAAIVEVVSGKPFEAFVERAVLIPAGLSHTGFCGRLPPNEKLAPSADPDTPPPCVAGVTPVDWADRGATGLVSTAADLLRWSILLRAGRILSAASRAALERGKVFVRHEGNDDIYYSYGARVYMQGRRRREVWHSGYDVRVGQSSTVRILDSGITIVVLSNSGLDAIGQPRAAVIARGVERCSARG
ncbi:MAG TPA: serine hydrolase domain-containing protein [Gemmatimonadaceae bacterium]|nr:serine hydrolase domain-containing protein [Gemmatimonadaceae bacterium]